MPALVFNPKEEVPRFSEILKFNRYKTIVDNPNLVLPMIAQGSLRPEHVEAMQAVYPALYQAQMKMLVERVMTRNRNLGLQTRANPEEILCEPTPPTHKAALENHLRTLYLMTCLGMSFGRHVKR